MSNPVLTFHYEKSVTLTTKSKSFKEAIKFVLDRKEPTTFTPIKIVAQSTGKTFYFDEPKFKAYLDGELTESEILEATQCDGLFRNMVDIQLSKHDLIDTGSLWMLNDSKYILIDQDRYIPIKAPDSNFIKI